MNNPMEYFYKNSAEIYEITSDGSYEPKERERLIKTIACDVQPYSGGLAEEIQGFSQSEKIKIFCNADEELKRGRYIKTGGEMYIIIDVQKWRMGYEITAERRDIH